LIAAALVVTGAASPAFAVETFAQFDQITDVDTIRFTNNANGTGSLTTIDPALVTFEFLNPFDPALLMQDAFFSLDATAVGPSIPGLLDVDQLIATGTMSFTRATPFGPGGLTNLLTISFTNAVLSGTLGSGAATFDGGQTLIGTATFSSDFINFTGSSQRSFALGFSAVTPTISLGPAGMLNSFTADSDGTFSFEGGGGGGNVIPEPATWAMMILGFGGVGVLMRRRRGRAAFA
jgi:hypothetical protein